MKQRIAIVGGGWAGIACAVELADQGVPVTLFEAAQQLGGRARRVEWEGLAIDNGQHLMIGAYRETLRLMARLDSTQKLERRPLELRMPDFHLRLRNLPAPLHLAFGLLLANGLRPSDKLAAARFMRHLQHIDFRLDSDLSASNLLALNKQPANLIARFWAPICIAALNTPLDSASAQVFCNVLRDSLAGARTDCDLLFNRADLSGLVADSAITFLRQRKSEVRLASKVNRISSTEAGFHLSEADFSTSHVVLATHPARLPAMLSDLPEMASTLRLISAFTWQPILTFWLHFSVPLKFPFPMLGLGDSNAPWVFERNDIAPGMVAIVVSAEGPHLRLPAEQLRDDYLHLLADQFGALPELLKSKVIIEKRATYACIPNMQRPGNRTPIKGLYLAGDYTADADSTHTYPATLEAAVRSGVECARQITSDRK